MKTPKKQKGVTSIELIIVIAFIFICAIVGTMPAANFWYTEQGVLKKIRIQHPQATHIIDHSRNSWDYSEIVVKEGESNKTYYLNTNILFNYEIRPDD